MAELRLSGKDRNKSITTKAAKELIAIKEKTLESQQKQTKLLKELEAREGRSEAKMDLNHHLYEEAGTPDAGKPKKQEEEER